MIKKTIGAFVVVTVVGFILLGREARSYFRTSVSHVRQAIKSELPIEFEVERARKMVEEILPDIRQCMHVIAEEEVNVEELNREIDRRTAEIQTFKATVLAQRANLGTGDVVTASAVSPSGAKRDLAIKFQQFKLMEETLGSKRQIMEARQKALQAAREKLEAMLTTKQDLQVQLEQLEARVKTLQAAEVASNVIIDDTQLNRAKALILELNKNLDIKQRVLDAEGHLVLPSTPMVGHEVPENLLEQIDHHFGLPALPNLNVSTVVPPAIPLPGMK